MKKETFLETLKNISPERINEIIKQKGKESKVIFPFTFVKKENTK